MTPLRNVPANWSTQSLKLQLLWFDRAGKQLGMIGEPGFFEAIRLSPDE
jgi:hypothetical protein